MKKNMKIIVMCLLIIFAVLSCNTQEKKAKVDYILVNPNPVSISRGAIQNFTAIVYGTNNPSQAVAWSITGNNSLFTTITPNGLLTVASDETAINLLIMATSDFDRSKIGTVTAQVLQPIVTEIIISPSWVNIEKGATQSFTAVVNGTNNPPQTVTWSVTGNNSSSTKINTSGQLTVASAETSAALTVRATSAFDTSKSGTSAVTISQPSIESIEVSPNPVTLSKGATQDFTAIVNGINNPPLTVTWSITGNSSSSTTINSSGHLTVASAETSAALTVRATSAFDESKSGTSAVTISQPSIESIEVSPNPVTLSKGATQDFTAIVNGINNPPLTVTWSITGNSSSSTTINSSGHLTVASAETSAALTVRATSTFDTSKSGLATVYISQPVIESVVVNPSTVTLGKGDIQVFTAIVNGSNNPPQTVTWSVTGNNSSSTTISTSGQLTIASAETSAALTVCATSTFDTGKSGVATISISPPIITSIFISPNLATVNVGNTQNFTAVVNGQYNPPQTVTWSITGNNSSSTTISSSGILSVASLETTTEIIVRATSTVDLGISGVATVSVIPKYISFGGLVWRVLALDTLNNRALIISENVIETRAYHTSQTSITWENCSLRAYLNNDFYNSFTEIDRSRIQPTIVQNPNNPTHGTSGGNITNDKIFLLSIAEAQTYFTSNADRIATSNGTAVWWWLRSPGSDTNHAAYVGNNGNFYMYGNYVSITNGGVRPALWLNL